MLPTLSIGPLAIPAYPFLALVAVWVGLWLTARRAAGLGFAGDHAYNAGLYGLVAGVIGARLWFVVLHWANYAPDLLQAFSLSRSAMSPGAGLAAAGLAVLAYLQRNAIPLGSFLDAAAPGAAVALAIINVGAFLGGVAVGVATESGLGLAVGGETRLPVQLYEAAGCLLIAGLLYFGRYRPWPGFQFWLGVVAYGAIKLILEVFRANPPTIGDGYLANQIYALAAIVAGLAVMAYFFTQFDFNPQKTDD